MRISRSTDCTCMTDNMTSNLLSVSQVLVAAVEGEVEEEGAAWELLTLTGVRMMALVSDMTERRPTWSTFGTDPCPDCPPWLGLPGYGGGGKTEEKLLIAGRKKAERAASKNDNASMKILKSINKEIERQLGKKKKATSDEICDLELGDECIDKAKEVLVDVFRNQVPSDWDHRKDLYHLALCVCRSLSSDKYGDLLGNHEDPDSIMFWLLDFKTQAEGILLRHSANGFTEHENNDILLATMVSDVADTAMKVSKRCQAKKPTADLIMIDQGQIYRQELGPLRFDTVESMHNVSVVCNKETTRMATVHLNC